MKRLGRSERAARKRKGTRLHITKWVGAARTTLHLGRKKRLAGRRKYAAARRRQIAVWMRRYRRNRAVPPWVLERCLPGIRVTANPERQDTACAGASSVGL
jgi:hypothetical protein